MEIPTGFWQKIIAQHRTVSMTNVDARVEGALFIQCRACDGNTWQSWFPGDVAYECEIWKEARILGLLPVG